MKKLTNFYSWQAAYKNNYKNFLYEENNAISQQGKMPVNIIVGRFQPFHNGHLESAKELYKKNGLPVVLVVVRSKGKSGKGTVFSDATTDAYLKEVIKNTNFIIDYVVISRVAFDVELFPALRPKYEPVLFGAGADRVGGYERQRISMLVKHENKLNMRDDFRIVETKRHTSATEVREAILNDDRKTFEKLMPEFLHKFWNIFKQELEAWAASKK